MTSEQEAEIKKLLDDAAGKLNAALELYQQVSQYKAYTPKVKRYANAAFYECIDPIGQLKEKLGMNEE